MSLMERLLKTLRYNFLTEALDFVGVHQERTLQVRGCPPHKRGHPEPLGAGDCRTWGMNALLIFEMLEEILSHLTKEAFIVIPATSAMWA